METSILTSVKKVLGLAEDYTAFDQDILMHINTTFETLAQLGVGPEDGFAIEDATAEWADFLGGNGPRYNSVKTYVALKVKIIFDPPTNGYWVDALERQFKELEWRISLNRELTDYVAPEPEVDSEEVPEWAD